MCGSSYNLFILRGSQAKFESTTWFYLRALSVTDILYLLFMIGYLVKEILTDDSKTFDSRLTTSCSPRRSGKPGASSTTSPTGMSSSATPSSRRRQEYSSSPPYTSTSITTIINTTQHSLTPPYTSSSPSSPASSSSSRGSWSSPSRRTAEG